VGIQSPDYTGHAREHPPLQVPVLYSEAKPSCRLSFASNLSPSPITAFTSFVSDLGGVVISNLGLVGAGADDKWVVYLTKQLRSLVSGLYLVFRMSKQRFMPRQRVP
jgi:hypothetical protein